jgi:hypothetical protein
MEVLEEKDGMGTERPEEALKRSRGEASTAIKPCEGQPQLGPEVGKG